MKFCKIIFNKLFPNNGKFTAFADKLDDTANFSIWLLVRIIAAILSITAIMPIILLLLIVFNLEFFLTKCLFRYKITINYYSKEKFHKHIKPWIKDNVSYYSWTYHEIDYDTPIIFREKLVSTRVGMRGFDIYFKNKEDAILYELTWKGVNLSSLD